MRLWSSRRKAGQYIVSRAMRDGHHHYSVLAWDQGFEFLFPSGVAAWSSVHNGHIEMILRANSDELGRRARSRRPFNSDDYLRIASLDGGNWVMTAPVSYESRQQAIKAEVAVLDEEMKNRSDPRWDRIK